MMPSAFLLEVMAFVLGASIGSFLNVCIYRLPLDLSVNKPRRSFCPSCKKQIVWHQNIPLLSWLMLRARCANCGAPIAFRYFGVELLTALLFLAVWKSFSPPVAVAYFVFVSLVVVATFIDFEHFIIPDEITIGGTVAGVLACLAVPELMQTDSRLAAGIRSVLAAALAYVTLWIVLEVGKIAFGRKTVRLDTPTPFRWKREGEDAAFEVGEEHNVWSEYFARESDRLLMQCDQATVDHRQFGPATLEFYYNRVCVEGQEIVLDTVDKIGGVVRELQIPREAMGRGDLKFLASIGAFLGWRAVLFSIFAGSVVGSLVGLFTLIIGKRVWSAKLPFGPYLAFGALTWMFFGQRFIDWYMRLLVPAY